MRVECNFCGVEHMQGDCLNQSVEDYKRAISLHGFMPNITLIEE